MSEKQPTLPALTGLRFFAAAAVVLVHAFHSMRGEVFAGNDTLPARIADALTVNGSVGVNLFFLLSGFILAHTYLTDNELRGTRRAFWVARFARVYPVYLLGWAFFGCLLVRYNLGVGWPVAALPTGLLSLLLLQSWDPSVAYYWNGPGWSLSTEAVFYALFPLLGLSLLRYRTRQLVWLLAALYAGVLTIGLMDQHIAPPTPAAPPGLWWLTAAGNPLTRVPEFAAAKI